MAKPKRRRVYMTPEQLKDARKYVRMTQQALADALEVDRVTVARWEATPRAPELAGHYWPRHRRIDRAWARLIRETIRDVAKAQGDPLLPLHKIFSSTKSNT